MREEQEVPEVKEEQEVHEQQEAQEEQEVLEEQRRLKGRLVNPLQTYKQTQTHVSDCRKIVL